MEAKTIGDSIYYIVAVGTLGGLLLASSLVLFFIRYQRKLLKQQADMQKAELEHKQMLLNSIIQSQEEERVRISKDLHDHVGSALSTLRLMVSRLSKPGIDADSVKTVADESRKSIDGIIEDVRNVSHSLSPAGLELWGFHEALEAYCEKTAASSGLEIEVNDETGGMLRNMSFSDALSLFRVVQELMNNTIKHAQASQVIIVVKETADEVVLDYKDDGVGVDPETLKRPGIGVYNMANRLSMINATHEIESGKGLGYRFTVKIPATQIRKKSEHG